MSAPNFMTQRHFHLYATNDLELYDPLSEEYYPDFILLEEIQDKVSELNKQLTFYFIDLQDGYFDGLQTFVKPESLLHNSYDNSNDILEYYEDFDGKEIFAAYGYNKHILRKKIIAEIKFINNKLLPQLKDYTFEKLAVAAQFSNGETIYYEDK